jgi:Protein of unknown function (DUF4239)
VPDVSLALITFACTFCGAMGATFLRGRLPSEHLSKESQDVVRLGIGLVATMTALLLGLVTAAARGTFDDQDAAMRRSATAVLTLDRHLARYGPETKPTRDLIRAVVAYRLKAIWNEGSGDSRGQADSAEGTPPIEQIENQILNLSPQTENQRWFKTEALKLADEVVRTRWQVLGFSGGSVPLPFLIVVIFWLTVTFSSFGLYAPRNSTVIAVLFVAAFSVAAAVFLILELDGPFTGFIKISSDPFRFALSELGH